MMEDEIIARSAQQGRGDSSPEDTQQATLPCWTIDRSVHELDTSTASASRPGYMHGDTMVGIAKECSD